jgi:hypothetical protein
MIAVPPTRLREARCKGVSCGATTRSFFKGISEKGYLIAPASAFWCELMRWHFDAASAASVFYDSADEGITPSDRSI